MSFAASLLSLLAAAIPAAAFNAATPVDMPMRSGESTMFDGLFTDIYHLDPKTQMLLAYTKAADRALYPGADVTYGEILPESVENISARFTHLQRPQCEFWDLGSGAGRMAIQQFIQNDWKRTMGVELVKRRFDMAEDALVQLERIYKDLPDPVAKLLHHRIGENATLTITKQPNGVEFGRRACFGNEERELCFVNQDMTKIEGMEKACAVFMCSTCFPEKLLSTMMQKQFSKMQPGSLVVSLKELPANELEQDGLTHEEHFLQQMSWTKKGVDSGVEVYKRSEEHSEIQPIKVDSHVYQAF